MKMEMKEMEELFMKVMANMKSKESINGDLTLFSNAKSRNKRKEYKDAGKKYCEKKNISIIFLKENFIDKINKKYNSLGKKEKKTLNFTIFPGIYEAGMGDLNFPKIKKETIKVLNALFFSVDDLPSPEKTNNIEIEITPIEKIEEKNFGIHFLNKSFIKKKDGLGSGSEIVDEKGDKFYREKLNL